MPKKNKGKKNKGNKPVETGKKNKQNKGDKPVETVKMLPEKETPSDIDIVSAYQRLCGGDEINGIGFVGSNDLDKHMVYKILDHDPSDTGLKYHPFYLLFCDIQIPNKEGFTVFRIYFHPFSDYTVFKKNYKEYEYHTKEAGRGYDELPYFHCSLFKKDTDPHSIIMKDFPCTKKCGFRGDCQNNDCQDCQDDYDCQDCQDYFDRTDWDEIPVWCNYCYGNLYGEHSIIEPEQLMCLLKMKNELEFNDIPLGNVVVIEKRTVPYPDLKSKIFELECVKEIEYDCSEKIGNAIKKTNFQIEEKGKELEKHEKKVVDMQLLIETYTRKGLFKGIEEWNNEKKINKDIENRNASLMKKYQENVGIIKQIEKLGKELPESMRPVIHELPVPEQFPRVEKAYEELEKIIYNVGLVPDHKPFDFKKVVEDIEDIPTNLNNMISDVSKIRQEIIRLEQMLQQQIEQDNYDINCIMRFTFGDMDFPDEYIGKLKAELEAMIKKEEDDLKKKKESDELARRLAIQRQIDNLQKRLT